MLTQARLRELIHYDPVTGLFTWLRSSGRVSAGDRAGTLCKDSGYRFIIVDGKRYREARLAWLYMTGEWPPAPLEVDHENRKRDDNRWENLGLLTSTQNKLNTAGKKSNTSGYPGVTFDKTAGRYKAMIRKDGRRISLGYFTDPAEAGRAYAAARI